MGKLARYYSVFAIGIFVCLLIANCTVSQAYDTSFKECDFTCYIDKGQTFTGVQTRKGIAASSEALIGYTAIVYTEDYEFVGIYEIEDKIGTKWGRSGTLEEPHVIDVWCESLEEAKELMKLTNGKVIIQLVYAEG